MDENIKCSSCGQNIDTSIEQTEVALAYQLCDTCATELLTAECKC